MEFTKMAQSSIQVAITTSSPGSIPGGNPGAVVINTGGGNDYTYLLIGAGIGIAIALALGGRRHV